MLAEFLCFSFDSSVGELLITPDGGHPAALGPADPALIQVLTPKLLGGGS